MKGKLIILMAVLTLAFAGFAMAQATNATVSVGTSGTSTSITGSAGQATAQGGNVTYVNISQTQTTTKWQGFYGNVTTNLILGLGANDFYQFTAPTALAVYASTNATFNFAAAEPALATDVNTRWNMGTNSDNFTSVYSLNDYNNADFVGNTYRTQLDGNAHTSYVLDDSTTADKTNFAFGSPVQDPGVGTFNGGPWEYELMVPVEAATETYYFYLSLA